MLRNENLIRGILLLHINIELGLIYEFFTKPNWKAIAIDNVIVIRAVYILKN